MEGEGYKGGGGGGGGEGRDKSSASSSQELQQRQWALSGCHHSGTEVIIAM